jgi:glycosyltransferase involved in cell wall biosynthesis
MSDDLTIVTIAQNEALKIEDCVRSCIGLGKHVVIDGGSSDDTVSIARRAGAEVVERLFRYPADQYNFGIETSGSRWVLILDADERIDQELRGSIEAVLEKTTEIAEAAFSVNRKNIVFGKWLKHGSWYPDYNLRLLDSSQCRYEDREVHARIVLRDNAQVGRLPGHIDHLTYDTVEQYIAKLNRFTSREVLARRKPRNSPELHAQIRRFWLRTPFRPLSKFLVEYVFKSAWRDGRLGFDMAILSAVYEFIVGVKSRQSRAIEDRDNRS